MGKGYKFLFDSLKAPRFVYQYWFKSAKTIKNLETRLASKACAAKYDEYLNSFNSLILYEWRKQKDLTINRGYYWDKLASELGPLRDPTASADGKFSSLFLADKLNKEALQKCLQGDLLDDTNEYQCSYHNITEVSQFDHLIDRITTNSSKLQIHSLGLRLNFSGDKSINSFVGAIQPVLEESLNMYRDINYEKLLLIAKQAKSGNSVRDLLIKLAENGLSSPKLVRGNDRLIITRSS